MTSASPPAHPTSNELRPLIRELLHVRTCEMARRAGRIPPYVSQLDYEQAKRELTGESDLDRQDAVFALLQAETADNPVNVARSAWTDSELDESILRLCNEFPEARMAACSRAREHCRWSTPRGTRESLLTEMRAILRLDMESERLALVAAA